LEKRVEKGPGRLRRGEVRVEYSIYVLLT